MKVLACITNQKSCERLIKKAKSMVDENSESLLILHVAKTGTNFLNNVKEGEALEYLFSVSKAAGATMTVLKSDDVLKTISDYVTENGINTIVIGQSPSDAKSESKSTTFHNMLRKNLYGIEIITVP